MGISKKAIVLAIFTCFCFCLAAESPPPDFYQQAKDQYNQKQFPQAAQSFQEYINANPEGPFIAESYYYLAELQEDFLQAISLYNKVIKEYSASPFADDAYYQLGMTYFLLGQYEQAAATFTELLTQIPTSAWADKAQYQLGKTLLNLKQTAAAKTAFQKLLKEYQGSPEIPLALIGLADCLKKEDKANLALKELLNFENLYPHSDLRSIVYFSIAECYDVLKDKDLAKAYYNKIIALFPNSFEAEAAKQRLLAEEVQPPPKSFYSLQLGAFSVETNAAQLKQKLEAQGYTDLYIEPIQRSEKTLYSLRLGHFGSEADLEAIKQKLVQEEKLTPRLVFNPN